MPKTPAILVLALLSVSLVVPVGLAADAPADDGTTTVILVRHAEKVRTDPHDNDPRLTDEGHARAAELVHVLGDADVDVIYSTPYRRTRDTARPLVKHLGLDLKKAPVGHHAENMARMIREKHAGQTVVVVGHSNTTPEVARALGIESPPIIEDHIFDDLWVITLPREGQPQMLRLRYGATSPDEPPPLADAGDRTSDQRGKPKKAA